MNGIAQVGGAAIAAGGAALGISEATKEENEPLEDTESQQDESETT